MKNEELKNVLNDKNLERVVSGVDDGSTDNAGKIIDTFLLSAVERNGLKK